VFLHGAAISGQIDSRKSPGRDIASTTPSCPMFSSIAGGPQCGHQDFRRSTAAAD
jgi:hypothetical protein